MTEKEEFPCHQVGKSITAVYCREGCNEPQRGVKAECPDSVTQTVTEKDVTEAFNSSSEAAKLAVQTYTDLLAMGGPEAAETQSGDLLQDVPQEERGDVERGMVILLALHQAKKK